MTICYILSGTERNAGSTKSLYILIQYLLNNGHDCYVVCPNNKGIYNDLIDIGVHCIVYPYRFAAYPKLSTLKDFATFLPKYWGRKIINVLSVKYFTKYLKSKNIDIVHSNTSVTDVGQNIAIKLGCRHITHIREYGDLDFNLKIPKLHSRLRAGNNYNIAITKDILRYHKLENDKKSVVIYNGIEKKGNIRFCPSKENYLLYAGRIESTKGIQELVEAYIEVNTLNPHYPFKLLIAGEAKSTPQKILKSQLVNLISKYPGIAARIEFLGEQNNVSDLYYKAYATIIPSFNEGFGRVMPEAIFNGCLVIGRNTGGTKEQFDNGNTYSNAEIGIRFTTKDELISILSDLSNTDITSYFDIINKAQITVGKLYTQESYTKNILNLYYQLTNLKES